jgi:hypothetical protein
MDFSQLAMIFCLVVVILVWRFWPEPTTKETSTESKSCRQCSAINDFRKADLHLSKHLDQTKLDQIRLEFISKMMARHVIVGVSDSHDPNFKPVSTRS